MAQHKGPWPAGTPAWIDISVTDIERSKAFYTAVLGWDYGESDPEFGGYTNAMVNGEVVAGLAPPMEGMDAPPHVWTTYLAVEDTAAADEKITGAGATSMFPPMEVGPFGTMALYVDPTGAVFGTWKSGEHTGFALVDEPGTVGWNEAMVGDFEAGKAFYQQVFGYEYQDIEGMTYAMFSAPNGERPAGGIAPAEEGQPPHWAVTFLVDGTDDGLQRVVDNGGTALMQPFDTEYGRIAVATGPDGEPFALMTLPKDPPPM